MTQALPNTPKKSRKTITWVAIIAVLALICIGGCNSYNSMNVLSHDVDNAWAQVQTQYQRRADLIPNLVNSVKGYTAHESGTLENVTAARAGLLTAENAVKESANTPAPQTEQEIQQYLATQEKLRSAMSIYVNAVHEAYPDLKANTLFQDLQTQLEGTENRIATERGRYNEVVRDFNIKVSRFPTVIFAKLFGFSERVPFQATQEAQSAPVVQF